MIRYTKSAIIVAAAMASLSVLPAPAQAQSQQEYRGTPAQQAACRPNVFRFCAGEIPDVRKITACLRRNINKLTPDCAAVFAEQDQQQQSH